MLRAEVATNVALFYELGEERATSCGVFGQHVDQNGGVQQNGHRVRFLVGFAGAVRASPSLRMCLTQVAVPAASSGWSLDCHAGWARSAERPAAFRRRSSARAVSTRKALRPRGPTAESISAMRSSGRTMCARCDPICKSSLRHCAIILDGLGTSVRPGWLCRRSREGRDPRGSRLLGPTESSGGIHCRPQGKGPGRRSCAAVVENPQGW